MTPEAQRIAIAEACGWTEVRRAECIAGQVSGIPPTKGIRDWVPKYHADLNAMHEAEKALQHFGHYVDQLASVMDLPRSTFGTVGATAAQRAEAFLRTIGKWRDK